MVQNISGLQVPVHDLELDQLIKPTCDLPHDLVGPGLVHRAPLGQEFKQRLLAVLHHQEDAPPLVDYLVKFDDVLVPQVAESVDLVLKSVAGPIRSGFWHFLDGEEKPIGRGLIDLPAGPLADVILDLVLANPPHQLFRFSR